MKSWNYDILELEELGQCFTNFNAHTNCFRFCPESDSVVPLEPSFPISKSFQVMPMLMFQDHTWSGKELVHLVSERLVGFSKPCCFTPFQAY